VRRHLVELRDDDGRSLVVYDDDDRAVTLALYGAGVGVLFELTDAQLAVLGDLFWVRSQLRAASCAAPLRAADVCGGGSVTAGRTSARAARMFANLERMRGARR